MSAVSIATLAQTLLFAIAAQGDDSVYESAFRQSIEDGKPLLVFVTADWCAGCKSMQTDVIPEVERQGKLEGYNYAAIDYDRDRKLAKRLIRSRRIPQLILFKKTDEGWQRWYMSGFKPVDSVVEFLNNGDEPEVASLPDMSTR